MAGGITPKGGKKGRKIGKGSHKLARSKWGSYQGLMAHQATLKAKRLAKRRCEACGILFQSRSVFLRHVKQVHP